MSTQTLLGSLQQSDEEMVMSLINGRKNPPDLFGTQIAHDVIPCFYEIFKQNHDKKTLKLVIRSNGGLLEAPLPIVNLIREFFEKFIVYVPENAHSAATLVSLGADTIIMTPIASFSPVDPQLNVPNPSEDNNKTHFSFSVEDVAGYYKLLEQLKITDEGRIQALEMLTKTLPPALLGQIERVRELIHILADKIIKAQTIDETTKELIIKKLAEEIPSHRYWISRAEAKELGLPVECADEQTRQVLDDLMAEYKSKLHEDEHELVVNIPDESATLERQYDRGFIETPELSYSFVTKFVFHRNGKVDRSINEWRLRDDDSDNS